MKNHLILDFDGTLADSSPGIHYSFSLACSKLGLDSPPLDEFHLLIGPPVQHIAYNLFPHLDSLDLEKFRVAFREDYDKKSYLHSDWYPGVPETLVKLAAYPGLRLSVVTNKPTRPTVELLSSGNLLHLFHRVIGIDYLQHMKSGTVFQSKVDALRYILLSSPFVSRYCFYVGDTPGDQMACSKCDIPFVAALYGFHHWDNERRPLFCLENFTSLFSLILDPNFFAHVGNYVAN